jgi:hypothetical protein
MNENRGPWYLLTGLILGLALGLAYAWLISPVAYVDTPPISLRADYKDQYRVMIALAYASNGDLGRARARLALLGPEEPGPLVANLALRLAAEDRPASEVQSLALLAEALGSPVEIIAPTATLPPTTVVTRTLTPPPVASFTSTLSPATPTPTAANGNATPTQPATLAAGVTTTTLPTRTSTPTQPAPFVLRERQFVCDPALTAPQIQVFVFDRQEQPLPGVALEISWNGGQERMYTGLKPEISPGYADFIMSTEVVYAVRPGDGGQTAGDLQASDCSAAGGERYPGSWRLTYVRP